MSNLILNEKIKIAAENILNPGAKQTYSVIKKYKNGSYLVRAESAHTIPQKRRIKPHRATPSFSY